MRFVREHADPIEADIQAHYGLNLWSEMAAGRLSLRRLGVLLRHLPPDSATAVAVHGPAARWTLTHDLLAFIGNGVWAGVWQRGGGKSSSKPTPVQRPRSTASDRSLLDRLKDARARAQAMRERRERRER